MKRIIHHVRKQPEHIKRHILHVSMIICAVILFFLWIYSLGTNLTNTDTQTKIGQDLKPFSILRDDIMQKIQ